MNNNIVKFLRQLDYICFATAIVGAIPLLLFEFLSQKKYFEYTVYIFTIVFVMYCVILFIRLYLSIKMKNNENFTLSKKEKIKYSIYLMLSVFCTVWFIFISINM